MYTYNQPFPVFFRAIVLCLIFQWYIPEIHGQSGKKPIDSLNLTASDSIEKKITDWEWEKHQDSLQKEDLEEKLKALGASEITKRRQLEKQIRDFETRDSIKKAALSRQIDSLRTTTKGFPVMGLLNDTLFMMYSRIGGFTPADRAAAISNRIKAIGKRMVFKKDSISVVAVEGKVELHYGDIIITTISDTDAIWNNSTKEMLGEDYKKIVTEAIERYRKETSAITLAKEIGLALLAIMLTGLIIFFIVKFFRWIHLKLQHQEGKLLKGVTIKNYSLFDSKGMVKILQRIAVIAKWICIIAMIYIALPVVFSIFPWTTNIADNLIGYIHDPLKKIAKSIWDYIPNLFTIIILWLIFHYIQKFYYFLKTEIESGKLTINGFYPEWANPTFQIVRILHYAFLFILIFPFLPGSDSPIFKGVSVFLGFLFTFGSAGSLSNIIAGIVLTYMRQFTLGDRVKIGDVSGDVIEKSLLVTRIKTVKNEIISIPNSTVMSSHTINYSVEAKNEGLILHTTVTIGYDAPWRSVHEALLKAAEKTEGVNKSPKPFILQTSLDDFYVSYQLNVYTKEANHQARIYSVLHQHIQDCFNEAGIEIMSPHYRAERDGNKTTIPDTYSSYTRPGQEF